MRFRNLGARGRITIVFGSLTILGGVGIFEATYWTSQDRYLVQMMQAADYASARGESDPMLAIVDSLNRAAKTDRVTFLALDVCMVLGAFVALCGLYQCQKAERRLSALGRAQ